MGALLSRLIPWVRPRYIEGAAGDSTTSSDADTLSIDSADSLIAFTFTQNPPSPLTRKTKDPKEVLIDRLPVDLLLR